MVNSVGVVATAAISAVLVGEALLNAPEISRAAMAWVQTAQTPATEPVDPGKAGADGPATAGRGPTAYISKGRDGHFWAWATIGGHPVRVLVDTGATTVALTPDDARRAGVDLEMLVYNRDVNTAQGMTEAAAVVLDHVSVAGAVIDHVQALVVPHGLSTSLLGMSFLGRLDSFEATRSSLVLHP